MHLRHRVDLASNKMQSALVYGGAKGNSRKFPMQVSDLFFLMARNRLECQVLEIAGH